jgi:hypothetical protein
MIKYPAGESPKATGVQNPHLLIPAKPVAAPAMAGQAG